MIALSDFSGGLNLRDSPNEIAPNETPASSDWTLDQRGALQWRKGCLNVASLPGTSGKLAYIFYSAALDQWLCAREGTGPTVLHLYSRPGDLSGAWTDRGQFNPNAGAVAAFVDWPGNPPKVLIATSLRTTGIGGVAICSWDGTTATTISSSIGGTAVALWQNRIWVAGYPINDANGNLTRLFASKIGDPTVWAPPDGLTVDLRDKDARPLTGLGIAGAALVVFKKRSAYRVTDPATGAYSAVDSSSGCLGAPSVVALKGRLYTWGADGLYEWDGVGPGRNVGDKVRPYFTTPTLPDEPPIGGVVDGKVVYCFADDFGTVRDDLLEFHPKAGWLMYHKLASTTKDQIGSFVSKDNALYAAISDGDVIFRMFTETAGADDGTVAGFLGRNTYRTPWLRPNGGKLARIIRAQVEGLLVTGGTNVLTLKVYTDWDLSTPVLTFNLTADLRGGDSADQAETSILHSLGHARVFAFEFIATTAAGAAQINSLALDAIALEG